MKKFIFVLSAAVFFSCSAFAANLVKFTRITNSVQIKTPDGEINIYKDLHDIPKLVYGSKILAAGGTAEIQIFNTASITLEKNQEIMLLKNPVSKEIEILKVESREKKPKFEKIKAWLGDYASASFGSDTKVTFFENYPSIIFKVKKGEAVVKGIGGREYLLTQGEYYESKQNILK